MKITGQKLGEELRDGTGGFLCCRRVAASLTAMSMASLGVIALYQLGIFRGLPEPPFPGLNAEKVNGSTEAYALLNTPDAVLGLGSYAATLGLAAMGGANRARTTPWIPLAFAAKAGLDALQAATLTRKSWVRYRAFSLYSLVTALATFLALPAIMPEARTAWREISGKSR
jgi:hypothetical protein